MTMRGVALWVVLCAVPTWADDGGGDLFDASTPDASVGQGGADQDNPEGMDGQMPTTCNLDRDCATGFHCQANKCVYAGLKQTSGGCLGDTVPLLAPLTVPLLLLWRRRQLR